MNHIPLKLSQEKIDNLIALSEQMVKLEPYMRFGQSFIYYYCMTNTTSTTFPDLFYTKDRELAIQLINKHYLEETPMLIGRIEKWIITSKGNIVGELFTSDGNQEVVELKLITSQIDFTTEDEHGYVETEAGRIILGTQKS